MAWQANASVERHDHGGDGSAQGIAENGPWCRVHEHQGPPLLQCRGDDIAQP
jgi:hypothetical protein